MALESAKFTAIHNKRGSDLTAMQSAFDNDKHLDIIDFPAEAAMLFQIKKMQEELEYLRTEISLNKAKVSLAGPSTSISFGDLITTTSRGRTTYTIVLTATKNGVSKSTTLTLT